MKFSPDLNTLIYSTYLGGTGDDAGYGLAINKTTNDVYVVGATASNDFTGNTAGTVQPGFNGGIA
ncbi:SBBP repeat-containing protein, partial [Acinetobacter baumannii]